MTTIVIINNGIVGLESLVGIFKKWRKEINILTAQEVQAAINIISEQQVDLVVYDLSLPGNQKLDDFSQLTNTFPYIPCIAIVQKGALEALQLGASYCLERPFSPDQLLQHSEELLKIATSGTVEGIATHSLLQMLETEEKTCTLKVLSKEGTGLLYMLNGTVISAETGELKNEKAVYTILAWEEAVIKIKYFNSQRKQKIHTPLISLIMEAFRLKDERDNSELKKQGAQKPKLQFKHVSTVDNPISLNIGERLQMEFVNPETSLMTMMVGMFHDKYLIVTPPSPFSIVQEALDSKKRIVVKYIHMGKLFMFKTTLLKVIEDPHRLLFLSYPLVVHHHEFRTAKRTSIFIPCTFQLAGSPEYRGALLDMSNKGGLLQFNTKGNQSLPNIMLDEQVQLRCLLPGFSEEQNFSGLVRNIKKDHIETKIGIEFTQLQSYVQEKIERYLFSIESLYS